MEEQPEAPRKRRTQRPNNKFRVMCNVVTLVFIFAFPMAGSTSSACGPATLPRHEGILITERPSLHRYWVTHLPMRFGFLIPLNKLSTPLSDAGRRERESHARA